MARTILISAGGTGGHLFPAQALAQELGRRNRKAFVVTDKRGMRWQDNFPEAPMYQTMSGTTEQSGLLGRVMALLLLAIGALQTLMLILRYRPSIAIGFGGYPSLPGMFGAIASGTKTCLHEQNRVVGRANKLIAPRMKAIALTFPEPKGLGKRELARATLTGNPVRDAVIAMRAKPYPDIGDQSELNILVFGGSQGATIFSKVVPEAMANLPEELKSSVKLTQQCREEDLDEVRKAYDHSGLQVELATFFSDLPERMAEAHLVISRSGASTVCELMVIGRPAILVPLKGALDGDQAANAKYLEEAGAARMFTETEFTVEALNDQLVGILSDPQALIEAAAIAHNLGRPDAVTALADLVERTEKG